MASAASQYPTLYEVLKTVRPSGSSSRTQDISVVDGIKPAAVVKSEGEHIFTPEQLLNIRIPLQKVRDDEITGYQRHLRAHRAREFARFLNEHQSNYSKIIPVIEVSLTNGMLYYTDGQHRGAGAAIARKPMKVIITKRTEEEARMLFALQAKATRVNKNVLILNSSGAMEEYIQDAVTSNSHSWSNLITAAQSGTSKTKMSAASALALIRIYAARSYQVAGQITDEEQKRFNASDANDLAVLISAFGTKATNPYAYSTTSLRAITVAARRVFLENENSHEDDSARWVRHMSRFPFPQYGYLRKYHELADKLVEYWNKHLSNDRKVK